MPLRTGLINEIDPSVAVTPRVGANPRGRGRTFCRRPPCSAGAWVAVATAFPELFTDSEKRQADGILRNVYPEALGGKTWSGSAAGSMLVQGRFVLRTSPRVAAAIAKSRKRILCRTSRPNRTDISTCA
ncbi:hypothetical protein [Phyllobacterium zundukense]|uniref:Uncharacterized protein n=1 Tax=Phyllobacterium zundukense TaxID=1867719 RepID=A0ACD4CZM7_9HYPH|nr:hypothetical protein [Phyllobacterium zundukense]UXN59014.1 hypothetical protein N8E88_08970 [Phyllobacterium zundukense]